MVLIKAATKRTRQQRLAGTNRRLVDILNACGRKAGKYEKVLLEYAKESNWCSVPVSTDGRTSTGLGWIGPGIGPSLAKDVLNPPTYMPDAGKSLE